MATRTASEFGSFEENRSQIRTNDTAKKRGRPKGRTKEQSGRGFEESHRDHDSESASATEQAKTETIYFHEKKVKKRKQKKLSLEDANAQAQSLLSIVEKVLAERLGEEARFTEVERLLLNAGLSGILSSMHVETASKAAGLLWPLALGAGSVFYTLRVLELSRKHKEELLWKTNSSEL